MPTDLTSLPLELVAQIFQYLPKTDIWRLRRVSRTWTAILSSNVITSLCDSAFENRYKGRPVSCICYDTPGIAQIACDDRRIAYALSGVLYIQEIGGSLTKVRYTDHDVRTVAMHDMVAFLHNTDLMIWDGALQRLPVPDMTQENRHMIVGTQKSKVVIVDPGHGPSSDRPMMWIYDHSNGRWTTEDLSLRTYLPGGTVHCIHAEDMIIISTTYSARDHSQLLHFWSPHSQWTASYTAYGRPERCEITKLEVGYVVHITVEHVTHSVRITNEGITSVEGKILTDDSSYGRTPNGLRTRTGVLSPLPNRVILMRTYMVCIRGTQVYILKFDGPPGSLAPFTFESEADTTARVGKRTQGSFGRNKASAVKQRQETVMDHVLRAATRLWYSFGGELPGKYGRAGKS